MTDYVKSTNFTSKDALASGNPLKIIKGTEFDIEFNNLATAVATKADIISPALSGAPTAPTAAAGTNTTQLATTAFITTAITTAIAAAKEVLYPVGSIYTNAGVSTNPGTLLGFGTWTAFGAGRVMVGFNAGNALFDTAEETGGSYDATLVAHTHTGTTGTESANHSHTATTSISDPGHSHSWNFLPMKGTTLEAGSYAQGSGGTQPVTTSATGITASTSIGGISANHNHAFTTASSGSSATNANIQPYITVYMWKRTV